MNIKLPYEYFNICLLTYSKGLKTDCRDYVRIRWVTVTHNTPAQAIVGTKREPWHPRPPGIPHGDVFACPVSPFFLLKGKCHFLP